MFRALITLQGEKSPQVSAGIKVNGHTGLGLLVHGGGDVQLLGGHGRAGSGKGSLNWCVSPSVGVSTQDGAEEQGEGNDDEVGEVLEEHLDPIKHESII